MFYNWRIKSTKNLPRNHAVLGIFFQNCSGNEAGEFVKDNILTKSSPYNNIKTKSKDIILNKCNEIFTTSLLEIKVQYVTIQIWSWNIIRKSQSFILQNSFSSLNAFKPLLSAFLNTIISYNFVLFVAFRFLSTRSILNCFCKPAKGFLFIENLF